MSNAYETHLKSGVTTLCWCWAITRTDGVRLGFTDHDLGVSFDSINFEPEAGFDATALQSKLGISADNSEVMGALSSKCISHKDVHAGRFKGAAVQIWRVNWRDVTQRKLHFSGQLGEITHDETHFTAELRSLSDRLNQSNARRYLRQCTAQLGDSGCKFDLNSPNAQRTSTVSHSPERNIIYTAQIEGLAAGWFNAGRLKLTSGDNQGIDRIIAHDKIEGNQRCFILTQDLPYDIKDDVTLHLTLGCDKTTQQCRDKFSNLLNYQGFPFIPGEDWMFAYPKPS